MSMNMNKINMSHIFIQNSLSFIALEIKKEKKSLSDDLQSLYTVYTHQAQF